MIWFGTEEAKISRCILEKGFEQLDAVPGGTGAVSRRRI
jgi:hypothetical protein